MVHGLRSDPYRVIPRLITYTELCGLSLIPKAGTITA
nr:MAG TPA: hypothetical protein [Caudoviricetes sp.]